MLRVERGLGEWKVEMGSDYLREQGFFWGDHVLILGYSSGCTTCEYTQNHWVVHFKWVNFMICVCVCKESCFLNKKTDLHKKIQSGEFSQFTV